MAHYIMKPNQSKRSPSVFLILLSGVFLQVLNCHDACGQTKKTEHTLRLDPTTPGQSATPPTIDLDKLHWLFGRWVGTGFGGDCEEVFLPPWNESVTGAFRFASKGKLVFSEFFSLVPSPTGPVLRLKHFHPDLKSWEEKNETIDFAFVAMDTKSIWFDGLTYQLNDDGKLNVWVAMKDSKTNEYSEAAFVFERANFDSYVMTSNQLSPISQGFTEERLLQKEVLVDCDRETAFRMWTTSDGISQFLSPDSLIEPTPGGAYEVYFGLGPDENGLRGSQGSKVVSVLKNEHLIFEWPFPPIAPALRKSGVKTHVMILFQQTDDGRCRVTLKQYGWESGGEWDKGFNYFDKVWPAVLSQFQSACKAQSSEPSK